MEQIEILEFNIKELGGRHRFVRVILPHDYYLNITKRYPVIYMHDGQNLVDPAKYSGYSWDVANTVKKLSLENKIDNVIIVGIDSDESYRIQEYTNALSKSADKKIHKFTKESIFLPEAHLYAKFLVEELKPYIDQNYRTLSDRLNTAVAGSSCGGNVSFYIGSVYNDVFGIIGAFSPAYWIVKEDLYARIKNKTFLNKTRVYHDMGGKEEGLFSRFTCVKAAKKMANILEEKNLGANNHLFIIDYKARHTELFWQDRFHKFLTWAFTK